ncbi:MAG: hypothetical protein CMJ48_01200 [Planctomycetaceae bacterium]|nr:hypothetical protein [Planctomycetaceae bacterium]
MEVVAAIDQGTDVPRSPCRAIRAGHLRFLRVHQDDYATRAEARASVFGFLERFSNRVRRHSGLGYLSPEQFDQIA